jgi:hypothetical protein
VSNYTADQIKAARQADLVDWLQTHGFKLKREGSRNWRVSESGGLIVQGNHYYHGLSGAGGGNALDYLMKILGYSFQGAIQELANTVPAKQPINLPDIQSKTPAVAKDFKLPETGPNAKRVIAYLAQTRRLPYSLIIELLRDQLFFQDQKGNCVFPCISGGEGRGMVLPMSRTRI